MIETQYNAKVRVLRSDNGGEYQSSDLQKYLKGHDIIHQTTCSNTPQQNGVVERKNRHLLEVVRASLIAAKIPISYWGKAITSVAYLINREASELDMSGTTLESSSNDHPEIEKVIEEGRNSTIKPSPPSEQFGSEDVFIEIPNQLSFVEGVLNLEPDPFMKRLPHRHNRAIPNSVQEALADRRWKAAVNEEMKSLQKNETWELVECPPGKKPVGYRWIYIVKYKVDDSIERFKVRLVAKGYTQTYGIDYAETFTPVAKINTVRVLLSLATNLDWPLQQFDVKNAFLHGELSEEVYMDLPPRCMVLEKQWKIPETYGEIMYLAHTRPDLAYALSVSIEVYIDADWAGAVNDRRSTSGYFTFVGGNLVTRKSKKQNVVARSSAEEEFRGMALGLCEVLWLRLLLQDLGYLSRQPIRLLCDNKVACDIAHNPVQHDRTKHVEVDRFFIKEKLNDKIVELPKIRLEDQLADILTKAAVLSRVFSKILDKLDMCDIYAPT
ncbi:Retrovirus-related Pol polyprotein from transposon RE1 [Vitis vinifera]|uniref:Retrovirus-related Pol polyprotein from transposon RE1 n=1 Tax=Vitis vinifera TaxID=29760 RepID=A0A438BMQ6_VITVI|nr:Retrovirus-related Pol polyprotein from transposon RE1 [Vitis vinifera]